MRSRKRKWIWIVAALVVIAGAGVGGYLVLSDDDDVPDGEPIASPIDSEPPEVVYVEGNVLKRIGPGQSDGEQLAEGISATSIASPDSSSLTWVAFAGPEEPVTHLYTFGSEGVETIPGAAPVWKTDGSAFAVLQPLGETTCQPDICDGPVEVHVVEPDSGERTELLNRGRWSLHGWLGDDLVVRDLAGSDDALLVIGKNEMSPLGVPAKTISSISPDGSYIITAPPDTAPELLSVSDGSVEPVGTIGGPDTVLTSIAWSEDSARVAAVATELEGSTELVVFGTDDLEPSPVTDLEPSGDVYWAPGGGGLVFTAVNRDDVQLEATYCPLDGSDCTTYFTWQTGTRLIAAT